MLLDILRGDGPYEQLFRLNWFTPYLLGYLLVAVLTPMAGVVVAAKLVVAGAFAAMPWAVRSVIPRERLPDGWLLLLLPGLYSFAFEWGFLNFIVAVPVGLAVLGMALRHNSAPTLRGAMWLALAMPGLFLCHALVAGLVGAAAGLDALLYGRKHLVRRLAPLAAAVPPMLLWVLLTRDSESQVHMPVLWELGLHRIRRLPQLVFGGTSPQLPWLGIVILVLPFALRVLRFSRDLRRFVPLVITLAILMFVPNLVFGNYFTYQRFSIFLVPCILFASEAVPQPGPLRERWLRVFVAAAAVLWTAVLSLYMHGFDREARGFREVLDAMQPRKRALQLIVAPVSGYAPAPVYVHFASWYQAEKLGPVDFSFALFPVAVVRYRPETVPAVTQGFEWYPGTFDWKKHAGENYDYFVVRAAVDLSQQLFRTAPQRPKLLLAAGGWWLYENSAAKSADEQPARP